MGLSWQPLKSLGLFPWDVGPAHSGGRGWDFNGDRGRWSQVMGETGLRFSGHLAGNKEAKMK